MGSGGDPVVPWAIQVDLPEAEFKNYGHVNEITHPVQWKGDGRNLPFKDGVLDFSYNSHIAEDFEDWQGFLGEQVRVLKRGGLLIIMVPDKDRFRACVAAGQGDNLAHKHEFRVGELTEWANSRGDLHVMLDQLTLVRGIKDYNILFVAKKA